MGKIVRFQPRTVLRNRRFNTVFGDGVWRRLEGGGGDDFRGAVGGVLGGLAGRREGGAGCGGVRGGGWAPECGEVGELVRFLVVVCSSQEGPVWVEYRDEQRSEIRYRADLVAGCRGASDDRDHCDRVEPRAVGCALGGAFGRDGASVMGAVRASWFVCVSGEDGLADEASGVGAHPWARCEPTDGAPVMWVGHPPYKMLVGSLC